MVSYFIKIYESSNQKQSFDDIKFFIQLDEDFIVCDSIFKKFVDEFVTSSDVFEKLNLHKHQISIIFSSKKICNEIYKKLLHYLNTTYLSKRQAGQKINLENTTTFFTKTSINQTYQIQVSNLEKIYELIKPKVKIEHETSSDAIKNSKYLQKDCQNDNENAVKVPFLLENTSVVLTADLLQGIFAFFDDLFKKIGWKDCDAMQNVDEKVENSNLLDFCIKNIQNTQLDRKIITNFLGIFNELNKNLTMSKIFVYIEVPTFITCFLMQSEDETLLDLKPLFCSFIRSIIKRNFDIIFEREDLASENSRYTEISADEFINQIFDSKKNKDMIATT